MSKQQGSLSSYIVGFVLSILFTLVPYFMVTEQLVSGIALLLWLAVFAVAQVLVQLVFFLHLGKEERPRWHSLAFGFMIVVVVIVVFGSLWIMNNLDYHMMPGHKIDTYIQEEEGIRPSEDSY